MSLDRLCCSTMLFGGHDRRAALSTIADLGFPAVDIWASGYLGTEDRIGSASLPRHIDPDTDRPKTVKAELTEFGLKLHALSIYRCDVPAKLRRIELAADLEAECVIFCAERVGLDRFAEETVGPVLGRCEALGVRLAIENHIDRAVDTLASMQALAAAFPSPAFGYALAPPHLAAIGESAVEAVRTLGAARLHSVYLWDLARGYVPEDSIDFGRGEEQLPGGGQIDFVPLDAALLNAVYDGRFNIGVHGTGAWTIERLRAEIGGSLGAIEEAFARSLASRQLPL